MPTISLSSIVSGVIVCIVYIYSTTAIQAQLSYIDNTSPSITQDISKVVRTDDMSNPIRDGSYLIIQSPDGTKRIPVASKTKLTTFAQSKLQIFSLMYKGINYVLSFVAAVAFGWILREGVRIVTAGPDDSRYKEAQSTIRRLVIALVGIAVSRLLVTFIYYLINIALG